MTQHKPYLVTIGTFDGVHRGHQFVIEQVLERTHLLDGGDLVEEVVEVHRVAGLQLQLVAYRRCLRSVVADNEDVIDEDARAGVDVETNIGAGAIGTYIGGSLALAGEQLVFLEQPAAAAELRSRGLRLDLTLDKRRAQHEASVLAPGAFVVAPRLEEALRYGPYDVVLYALKSFDTAAAIAGVVVSLVDAIFIAGHPAASSPAQGRAVTLAASAIGR